MNTRPRKIDGWVVIWKDASGRGTREEFMTENNANLFAKSIKKIGIASTYEIKRGKVSL